MSVGVGILGSVVLVDPDGNPYAAGTGASGITGPVALGSVLLIDPATGEPYKIGE